MNSYPIELLVQHAPLMFVAGIDAPPTTLPAVPIHDQPSPPLSDRRHGVSQESPETFVVLASRLRTAFAARRRGAIWDLNKARHFNVILVDKNIKFPPKKVVPTTSTKLDGSPSSQQTPCSPLSPLNPSSPLYPDGIIAPIWIRKHIELVPSVFVLFMRLWEAPPPASPLEAQNSGDREEERRRDAALAAEIAVRKKSTVERGIKLTVVLMASRRMLDHPTLDPRLSSIRRQSGLDARAALFVLSPLSPSELDEFITSLQKALLESALEYYSAHTKRVRRKKSRFPQQGTPLPPGSGPSTGRPLRSEGWIVRYDYKMATFAEFRMEDELARKHYQDCWEGLFDMFSSPAILPPRTKRWAEATVLADSVSLKICKLYLYQSEFSRAISHFNHHLHRLADLSRTWGLGEDNFEFWSWAARQYRLFAELLDCATRAGVQLPIMHGSIPVQPPPGAPVHGVVQSVNSISDTQGIPFGFNPTNSIQHAGYYYYAAANCTQQRYKYFVAASSKQDPPSLSSPAMANERKIDHQIIILELFTKAYETFKVQAVPKDRVTFFMAYRIAETYCASGKYDLGAKFFERIARTYRRERWGAMLRPILSMWCDCARQTGNVELSVRLLLEIMGLQSVTAAERTGFEEEVVEIIKTTSPSNPVVLEPTVISSLVVPSVLFWQNEVFVREPASFQLSLYSLPGGLQSLKLTSIQLYWNEHKRPVVIEHCDDSDIHSIIQVGDLYSNSLSNASGAGTSDDAVKANLRWHETDPKVLAGAITSSVSAELKLAMIVFRLDEKDWHIEIPISLAEDSLFTAASRWITTGPRPPPFLSVAHPNPHSCLVSFRPHRLSVTFDHPQPSYLGEQYPIVIKVTNLDDDELGFSVDILLQPTEEESANEMTLEGEISTSLLKGIQFGKLKPGETASKTLLLTSCGDEGSLGPDAPRDGAEDVNETLRTLAVSAIDPLRAAHNISYRRDPSPLPALLSLDGYEPEFFHCRSITSVTTVIVCRGPWELLIESIQLLPREVDQLRLASTSLPTVADEFPLLWKTDEAFTVVCEVSVGDTHDISSDGLPFPCELEVTWRRADAPQGIALTRTILHLPNLRPPDDGLIAILNTPSSAQLHNSFTLTITIQNRDNYRTAEVLLDVDSSEAFVLAGPRHARIPALLAATSHDITYKMIPLLTGVVALPTFRVQDQRRKANIASFVHAESERASVDGGAAQNTEVTGKLIKVVVAGRDWRSADEVETQLFDAAPRAHTIFVSPY